MLKVPYGQDAYSVIGKYIRDHITAIEDIIAVIEIDGITTNQLFMVDMNEENYFIWNNDWYEGEKSVALIDFFPVSEAINPSAQPDIKQAAKLLSDFIESCPGGDSYLITPDGEELRTDWGYATEGIQLIHDWAERRTDA